MDPALVPVMRRHRASPLPVWLLSAKLQTIDNNYATVDVFELIHGIGSWFVDLIESSYNSMNFLFRFRRFEMSWLMTQVSVVRCGDRVRILKWNSDN